MTEEQLYQIAKIIDNEYDGKQKTFTAKRTFGCWHLSTNQCDWSGFIKVWERDNKISSIEYLGADDDGWRPITNHSWQRVEKYLESLNQQPHQ